MENKDKDLLFMLKHGEEFIKAKYVEENNQIFYLSFDEESLYTNTDILLENTCHIYEENKIELEILVKEIHADKELMNKIKNNQGMKLMFVYDSQEFNKFLNLI